MKTRREIEADWKKRGYSCGLWTDPPGQVWEDFMHDSDELVVLLEGAIEIEIEGKTLRPEIGEEILVPTRAKHSVRNIGGRTARWLYGYSEK